MADTVGTGMRWKELNRKCTTNKITQVIASSFASCVAFLSCVACDVCSSSCRVIWLVFSLRHRIRRGVVVADGKCFFLLLSTQNPNSKPTKYTQSLHWTSHHITETERIEMKKRMWKVRDWRCVHGFLCSTLRQMSKVRNFNALSCLYQRRWRNGEMANWRRQYPKRQACLPGFKVCIRCVR